MQVELLKSNKPYWYIMRFWALKIVMKQGQVNKSTSDFKLKLGGESNILSDSWIPKEQFG